MVIGIAAKLMRVNLLSAIDKIENHIRIIFIQLPQPVFAPLKFLIDTQVFHIIQVDMTRHVQTYFLDGICTVERNVKPSRKPVALRINRYKSQIDARFAPHIDRVHDVVLVVGIGQHR